MHVGDVAHMRTIGPTCMSSGLRAYSRVCMWQRCFVRTDLFAVGEIVHANSGSWAPPPTLHEVG